MLNRNLKRRKSRRPPLDEDLILSWADEHYRVNGVWPSSDPCPIAGHDGENWHAIDMALRKGYRGLRPGSSLAFLLLARRRVPNNRSQPKFNVDQILRWADQFYSVRGRYPRSRDGAIYHSPSNTWMAVDRALRFGGRGLSGGTSLAQLLKTERKVRNGARLKNLSIERILAWADEHLERTGEWPTLNSGTVEAAPSETWIALNAALREGSRGLQPGYSLAGILVDGRGKRDARNIPPHCIETIAVWITAHAARHGSYPTSKSGAIEGAPGETWGAVHMCLLVGERGLPGGSSLAALKKSLIQLGRLPELPDRRSLKRDTPIGRPKGSRMPGRPTLDEDLILSWADAHFARHGVWPKESSGQVDAVPGENWRAISKALRKGHRGLPSSSSLSLLLASRRGVPQRRELSEPTTLPLS